MPAQPITKPSRLVANAHFMWAFCFCDEVCDEACVVTNLVVFGSDHWVGDGFPQVFADTVIQSTDFALTARFAAGVALRGSHGVDFHPKLTKTTKSMHCSIRLKS